MKCEEEIEDLYDFEDSAKNAVGHWFNHDFKETNSATKEIAEVYARARAFDHIRKILSELTTDEKNIRDSQTNNYVAGKMRAFENVEILMDDYKYIYKKLESGEPNAKK